MLGVSALWNNLSSNEKAQYKDGIPTTTEPGDRNIGNNRGNTSENANSWYSAENTNWIIAGEGEGNPNVGFEDANSEDDNDAEDHGNVRGVELFKQAKDYIDNYLDKWCSKVGTHSMFFPLTNWSTDMNVSQAVHIAKTANCKMVLFVVSKHLAAHIFQLVKATRSASNFVTTANCLDGTCSYAARLQAYLTGYGVEEIAKFAKPKSSEFFWFTYLVGFLSDQYGHLPLAARKPRPIYAVARMSTLVGKSASNLPAMPSDFDITLLLHAADKTKGAQCRWP